MTLKIASIEQILATRVRATFPYRIDFERLGYNNIDPMEDWCKEKCQGLWQSHHTYSIYFRFEDEKDAIMFMLRWSTADGNKIKCSTLSI